MQKRTQRGAESEVLIAQSRLALVHSSRLIEQSKARLLMDLLGRTERDGLGGGCPEQPTALPWS